MNKSMNVRDDKDLKVWQEATDFVKANLPANLGETFIKKCDELGLNYNERLLFRLMVADAVEFEFTMAMLKSHVSQEEAKVEDDVK